MSSHAVEQGIRSYRATATASLGAAGNSRATLGTGVVHDVFVLEEWVWRRVEFRLCDVLGKIEIVWCGFSREDFADELRSGEVEVEGTAAAAAEMGKHAGLFRLLHAAAQAPLKRDMHV